MYTTMASLTMYLKYLVSTKVGKKQKGLLENG